MLFWAEIGIIVKNSIGLAAIVCGLVAGSASAATLEQTYLFDAGTINSGSKTFNIDAFDSALGTLTGVEAILLGSLRIDAGQVEGAPITGFELSGSIKSQFRFTGDLGTTGRLGRANFSCQTRSGDDCTASYADQSLSLSGLFAGDVSDFTVPGAEFNVELTGSTDANGKISDPTTSWLATGSVVVTYSYDEPISAVPLPASMPLMLVGLAGIVGLARRKKHAA